ESDVEKDTEEDFPVFKKARTNESQELNNQLENFTNLTRKKQECDRALLKLFICCGIPFMIVEHPFFLEFVKCLNQAYEPPKRTHLSTTLLKTKNLVAKSYPYILPIRCIAHHINLITKDILKQQWASNIMKKCQSIVKWTKLSHQVGELLRDLQQEYLISGGGIQSS
ncbi:2083_t:CDS:2, partial [Racocetra persica]